MSNEGLSDYAPSENTLELPTNVHWVCEDCAPKPNPRYRWVPPKVFIGKLCKLKFTDDDVSEHMWVHCRGPAIDTGQELGGTLDCEPVILDELQRGDWIDFSRSEIEDLLERKEPQHERKR